MEAFPNCILRAMGQLFEVSYDRAKGDVWLTAAIAAPVPEPSQYALLLAGGAFLAARRFRRG
ncbi:PEP-CTERM sorting domain-containing protein [Paucibacter sp. KCTC 42545]|uniref:PEP-CTERM sorting domain-containing protein n=1 Tax=Paucibacter sp. KCTC 42545 TaxID=1768242 RepID=UPI0009EA1555